MDRFVNNAKNVMFMIKQNNYAKMSVFLVTN